jgi:hypothetical protein
MAMTFGSWQVKGCGRSSGVHFLELPEGVGGQFYFLEEELESTFEGSANKTW